MEGVDADVASGVLSTIGITDTSSKAESVKDDDGGNILDDILNTQEVKFEDEEPSSKCGDDAEMDDIEEDEDEDSLEEHKVGGGEPDLGSDISSDGESGNNSDISFASEKHSESEDDKESDVDEDESKNAEDQKSQSPESEKSEKSEGEKEAAEKKKKGKKYDYATKLNYLFRDARFFLVKSNNAENVALAKVTVIKILLRN